LIKGEGKPNNTDKPYEKIVVLSEVKQPKIASHQSMNINHGFFVDDINVTDIINDLISINEDFGHEETLILFLSSGRKKTPPFREG